VRAAALLAVLAVASAGCGGGGGGGNSLPAGADVAPASAPILVSVKTDFASPQWRNALGLLGKFPGAGDLLRQASLKSGSVDFEHDVKPALGPEVDVVYLDLAPGGPNVVGLTQPKDKAKFAELIEKGNSTGTGKLVTEEVGGWTVVADARSKLDAFRRASERDTLSSVREFKDAMSRLDDTSAVRAYVAGAPVQRVLDSALSRAGGAPNLTRDLAVMESIAASAHVEPGGVRAEADLATNPAAQPKTYTPKLAKSLPAGALLYASTADLAAPTRTILKLVARSKPKFETQLRQVETAFGLSLEGDVYPVISGEQALALYAAKPFPKVVFVMKVSDEGKARELAAAVLGPLKISGEFTVTSLSVGGERVDEISRPGSSVHGYVAVTGGKLIVTTARDTLATLVEGNGAKLADDPLYKRARADAKVPAKVAGLVYGDLTNGLPFAFDLAEANGRVVPPEARANTAPLKRSLLYAQQDENRFQLFGFLAIE
jgi:hypothetical protein